MNLNRFNQSQLYRRSLFTSSTTTHKPTFSQRNATKRSTQWKSGPWSFNPFVFSRKTSNFWKKYFLSTPSRKCLKSTANSVKLWSLVILWMLSTLLRMRRNQTIISSLKKWFLAWMPKLVKPLRFGNFMRILEFTNKNKRSNRNLVRFFMPLIAKKMFSKIN